MDTCICTAESLCCSPETTITLLIGYTQIQSILVLKKIFFKINKKKKKRKKSSYWDFPGSPVVKTLHFHQGACWFDPRSGN